MFIRPATPEDATDIGHVHVEAWREAYVDLLPLALLEKLDQDIRAERWRTAIRDGLTTVWVGGHERIEGWASVSEGRDPDRPRDLELSGIYILASAYGAGLGQQLLETAIGNAPAYLWVAADNSRAIRFYARNGFTPDGTRSTKKLEGHPVEVIRMVR